MQHVGGAARRSTAAIVSKRIGATSTRTTSVIRPPESSLRERDERGLLRGGGAGVDGDDRANGLRRFAAHLAHPEIAIARDGGGHRQAVERDAVGSCRS